ncbi:precorrin-8X methylmutase [Vallitalea okinawensis]|uniref:precorrin-8X methylmutase n=1 Tax=Vallitalea okinawensis TaxID=2078660 RepID=UPI000CFB6A84|nr:precorrin-8X methylmutase [Vallitalea okinawensis]
MNYQDFYKRPMNIENNSMSIIEAEMKSPESFTKQELQIVKRVIHTTADFDYENFIRMNHDFIQAFSEAIKKGLPIITDTNMVKAGINKRTLSQFGCEIHCFVGDEDVRKVARETGMTRSVKAIDKAVNTFDEALFVFGNAPTALVRLLELTEQKKAFPQGIVGVPVGFVGAKESKELLARHEVPHITTLSRKGGSNVAAAIVNAILYMIGER